MNDITSPELLAQVNPENKQLVKDFLSYLHSVDRSETTIKGYQNDLEIAFVWNLKYNDNKPFYDWTKRNVVAFQSWLINDNGNSPARVRRLKATLSSLSNYIENVLDDEYPNFRNIINKIESPVNEPVRKKTIIYEEDLEYILQEVVRKGRYDLACLTALAAYGGRRKSELCKFKVSDFDDDHLVCGGSLWKSSPMRTKGRGKKGKITCCYTLAHKFRPYLELWLKYREENGIESEWLFPSAEDPSVPIGTARVNSYMDSLSRLSGLDIYAHMFRHFFTTLLSNEGLPDSVIKEIQNWSSVEMVDVYRDRTTEDTLEMYFNADGIIQKERKGLSDL